MYISKTKTSYPITVSGDKTFIKRMLSIDIDEMEDDDFINSLIESATEQTEGYINQDIAYTNNAITIENYSGGKLIVNQGNFNAITSIINNDTSTLITSYNTVKSYFQFEISFDPTISCESLTLNFTTGWNNQNNVPRGLRQAILLKTLGLYDKTDMYDSTWENLCQQYKLL